MKLTLRRVPGNVKCYRVLGACAVGVFREPLALTRQKLPGSAAFFRAHVLHEIEHRFIFADRSGRARRKAAMCARNIGRGTRADCTGVESEPRVKTVARD